MPESAWDRAHRKRQGTVPAPAGSAWDRAHQKRSLPFLSGPAAQPESRLGPPSEEPARQSMPGEQFLAGLPIGAGDLLSVGAKAVEAVGAPMSMAPHRPGAPGRSFMDIMTDPNAVSSQLAQVPRDYVRKLGVPDPVTTGERFERNLGEETGASIIPGGVTLARGRQLGRLGKAPKHFKKIIEQSQKRRNRWAAQEAASVVGAAGGRTLASEDDVTGQMIGATAGAVGPLAASRMVRSGWRGLRNLRAMKSGSVSEAASHQRAAEILQRSAGDEATIEYTIANLKKIRAAQEGVSGVEGFAPTMGAAADSPGLRGLESDIAAMDPNFSLANQLSKGKGNEGLREALIRMGKHGDTSTDAAVASARSSMERAVLEIEETYGLGLNQIIDELDSLGARVNPDNLSEGARTLITKIDDEIYEPLRNRYGELNEALDQTGARARTKPYLDAMEQVRKDEGVIPERVELVEGMVPSAILDSGGRTQMVPGIVEEITPEFHWKTGTVDESVLKKIREMPEDAPISFLHKVEQDIRAKIRESPPEAEQYRRRMSMLLDAAKEIRQNVMDGNIVFREGASQGDIQTAAQLVGERNDLDAQYRAYKEVFRKTKKTGKTATGKVLAPKNGPAVTETLAIYANKVREGARNYKAVLKRTLQEARQADISPNPKYGMQYHEGMRAMEDYLVTQAYLSVRNTEGMPVGSLKAFYKKYRPVLEEFPNVKKRISSLERLGREAKKLGSWETVSRDQLQKSRLHLFIDDPPAAVRKVLSVTGEEAQGKAMRRLMMQSGSHAYRENAAGLRHVLWDDMLNSRVLQEDATSNLKNMAISGPQLRAWMMRNKGAIEALYSPEQLKKLDQINILADANARIQVFKKTRTRGEEDSAAIQMMEGGRWLSPIWSVPRKLAFSARTMYHMQERLTTSQAGNVIIKALSDPDGLGVTLLMADTPAARKRLRRWVGVNMPSLLPRLLVRPDEEKTQ